MIVSLFEEIISVLSSRDLTWEDVEWIGIAGEHTISKEYFKANAGEYDNSFGSAEVDTRLVVVGADWWLERHEYDGAEWWEYKKLPVKPETEKNETFFERKER